MAADLLLDRYSGAGLAVEVRWTTWELSVFEVEVPGREPVFVAVRRSHLDGFLADLWAGGLDGELIAQAGSPAVLRRRLADGDRVRGGEVVGSVADPATLPPAERDRRTGRIGGDPPRGRRRKREDQQDGRPPRQVRGLSRGVLIGAGAAVVVLVAAVAALASGGDDDALTVGAPVVPPLVSNDTTDTTFEESFSGTYRVTGTITEYEITPDAGYSNFEVGQVLTFEMHCGSILVETGERECSPSPVPGSFLIDGQPPTDQFAGAPIQSFSVEDLIDGSGEAVIEGKPCPDSDDQFPEPTIEVAMDGYGEETLSGTYRHTYDTLDCPLQAGGFHVLENIELVFTGEFLPDGGTVYDPGTSTSTSTPPSGGGGVQIPPTAVGG